MTPKPRRIVPLHTPMTDPNLGDDDFPEEPPDDDDDDSDDDSDDE